MTMKCSAFIATSLDGFIARKNGDILIPILIGEGIPLFGKLPHDVKLEHIATNAYASGFVQSKYRLINAT